MGGSINGLTGGLGSGSIWSGSVQKSYVPRVLSVLQERYPEWIKSSIWSRLSLNFNMMKPGKHLGERKVIVPTKNHKSIKSNIHELGRMCWKVGWFGLSRAWTQARRCCKLVSLAPKYATESQPGVWTAPITSIYSLLISSLVPRLVLEPNYI